MLICLVCDGADVAHETHAVGYLFSQVGPDGALHRIHFTTSADARPIPSDADHLGFVDWVEGSQTITETSTVQVRCRHCASVYTVDPDTREQLESRTSDYAMANLAELAGSVPGCASSSPAAPSITSAG